MLFPRAHPWTRRQKRLIVGACVVALASFGALVYYYEHYHRGPTDSVLFGTWQDTLPAMDSSTYVQFNPDHSLVCFAESMTQLIVVARGRWYAGGEYIYLRLDHKDEMSTQLLVWHIEDISPSDLRIRDRGAVSHFKRVDVKPPAASNQAMERTATRRALPFYVAWTLSLRPILALGGRRSSYSR